MGTKENGLKPRKQPAQRRSAFTVEAILEACIQVLIAEGKEGLTTTKVAERAGVSVGTLYQYFTDKNSLLAAVMCNHLNEVAEKVEQACQLNSGQPATLAVKAIVGAFFSAKMSQAEVSRALYLIAPELEGEAEVVKLSLKMQSVIKSLLETIPDIQLEDIEATTFLLTTSLLGPVQTLLAYNAPAQFIDQIEDQAARMLTRYLLFNEKETQ